MGKEQKTKSSKAFTLVELLAVIVILGILSVVGITAVSKYIEKARNETNIEAKDTLLVAAKQYLQDNKDQAPKAIGEYKIITAKELKDTKYLTSDLKNSRGETCMKESFVRVYKSEGTDYSYTAYLYCGNEKAPDEIEAISPVITKFDFSNADDVSSASFTMTMEGSEDKNNPLEIDSYSFTISTMLEDNTSYQEVYNSGSVPGNHNTKIIKSYKLVDYVDIVSVTSVRVNITVINEQGGVTSITKQTGIDSERDYGDTISPKCIKIENEAKPNEWINKHTIEKISGGYRKITATCGDGEGSGCLRGTFTKSFPNNDIYRGEKHYYWGAEYAYIEVKDNANNSSLTNAEAKASCRVRVNVDILSPKVEVTAITNDNIIKTVSAGGADENYNEFDDTAAITANSYELNKSPRDSNWIWFNEEYKDGVTYKIKVSDNLHLYKYTWETNETGVSKTEYVKNKSIIENIKVGNPDSKEESFPEQDLRINDNGLTSSEFVVQLKGEGIRYGKLTVYDRAGNKTVINIYANIDRTRPDVPETVITKTLKKNNLGADEDKDYQSKTWTNKYVKTYVNKDYHKDTISGFDKAEYEVRGHGISLNENATKKGDTDFTFDSNYQGKNSIRYRICDKANNCSNYSEIKEIWLDTINPVCTVSQNINKTIDEVDGYLSDAKWAGIGETITVTGTCSDQNAGKSGSGCVEETISYEYKDSINTTTAGAAGNNEGGTVKDNAGNEVSCSANQTVKIDHTAPICTTSIKYEVTDNSKGDGKLSSSGWLSKGEQAVVTAKCSETKDINSGCVTQPFSKTYNTEINISNAGAVDVGKGGTVKDAADNITNCDANKTVKIDQTDPVCNLSITYEGGDKKTHDNTESGWLSKGESARVTATCSDQGGSECATQTFSKLYQTDKLINTTTAGAGGDGISKSVSDTAGNTKICGYKTVKIDAVAPSCYTENCNNTAWTNQNRTIKYGCQDTNGSGCATALKDRTITETMKSFTLDEYIIKDIAGNERKCTPNCNVLVDKTTPTGSCSVSGNKINVNSKNDEHSGVSSVVYISSTSNRKQSTSSNSWKSSNTLGSSCGTTYYGHIKVIDKAGNSESFVCTGSYTTGSCCGASNPWGCTWKTACRNGRTFIYTSAAKTTYAGTVYHQKDSSCSDRLYLIEGSASKKLYIYSPCGNISWYPAGNAPYAYIWPNCVGGNNSACPYATCPG